MRLKADDAWRKAAHCARLAQQADDQTERDLYLRMRDAWITVANRYEFFDDPTGRDERSSARYCRAAVGALSSTRPPGTL